MKFPISVLMSHSASLIFLLASATVAVSDQGRPTTSEVEARLAEVQARFQLGAEFFVNRTETKESIQQHFRLMAEHGLTLARVFVIWDDVERVQGHWDFHAYDWVYEAAAANGIKIVATLCAEDPPGWVALTPFYHSRTDLSDPERRKHAAIYIEKVVGRYRNHSAQGFWLLMNEPALPECFTPSMRTRFGQWLERKYDSVEQVNKRWFRPIRSFTEPPAGAVWGEGGWMDYAAYLDWKEFNIQNLCDQLDWIGKEVKRHDPTHPTHINPAGLLTNLAPYGRDVWKEAKTSDFIGASIHPAWHFEDFRREDFGFAFGCTLDILRSISKKRPWWVTELQGGPTIYTGGFAMNPTPNEYTRWLWDTVGAGSKGAVFWSWHPRTIGREGGEWGLVAMDGTPSNRLKAVRAFAETLRRNPVLDKAVPQTSSVAILYNRQTLLLNDVDARGLDAHRKDALLSLWGCHRALQNSHIPADLVDIEKLRSDGAAVYDVLYLPHCYALDRQAAAAIRRYVEQGGTVWADGLLGWKDEYGNVASKVPGNLTDVFGFQTHDIDPVEQPFPLSEKGDKGGELWRIRLTLLDAEVLQRAPDGQPIATRKRFGKGEAVYFATALSLGYFRRSDPEARRWIANPAIAKNLQLPVQLKSGSERIVFRGMIASGKQVAILTNWGNDDDVTVSFRGRFANIVDIVSGVAVKTKSDDNATSATLHLAKDAAVVLLAE